MEIYLLKKVPMPETEVFSTFFVGLYYTVNFADDKNTYVARSALVLQLYSYHIPM